MATTINAAASAGLVTTADTSQILQLQTGGVTGITIDASQNVTLAKGLTVGATAAPAFSAWNSTTTTLVANTQTKINYTTTLFDTNSNYSTSLSRFTPTVAGYYQINAAWGEGLSTALMPLYIYIVKNGIIVKTNQTVCPNVNYTQALISGLIYLNGSTDYVEINGYTGSAYTNSSNARTNYFEAFLARSA